mgnify:CR=1|jgi:hypothetical protein
MTTTLYRLYDHTDLNTLATAVPSLEQAQEVLRVLEREYPNNHIEIESYTV